MGVRLLTSVFGVPFIVGVCLGQTSSTSGAARGMRVAVQHDQPSSPTQPARGRFLVASRALVDPNFAETVVLLLNADGRGAMGIVINRATKVKLAEVLPDVKALHEQPDRVFLGGPVGSHAMVLLIRAQNPPAKSEKILDEVYVTGSLAALHEALGRKGKSEHRLRAYAGYAGWGPGQLEREIARGDWLVGSGDAATIFDTQPERIWPTLIERFSGAWTRHDAGPGSGDPVPPS
jgi:putative transcriptional regulator